MSGYAPVIYGKWLYHLGMQRADSRQEQGEKQKGTKRVARRFVAHASSRVVQSQAPSGVACSSGKLIATAAGTMADM